MSPSGGSTFTTSAPRSASTRPQIGPDTTWERSSTRTPSSGRLTADALALMRGQPSTKRRHLPGCHTSWSSPQQRDAVDVPLGEARPAEHVRVRVEDAAAHRPAGRVQRAPELVDRLDRDPRRAVLGVALDRTVAVDQVRPHAVAQQVAEQDAVVALAVDGDREEAVVGRRGARGRSRPSAGDPARRTPHERSRIAMQSTSNSSPWSVKRPVTRPGWSMWAPWLNGGSWRVSSGRQSASKVRSNDTSSFSHPKRNTRPGSRQRRNMPPWRFCGVEQVGRLGERLVPAPLERRQLPRHDRGVVDHQHAAELDAHVGAGTPDRSSRAGCARAPSTRTRPSRSTTGRRSRVGGTGRPPGSAPTRRRCESVTVSFLLCSWRTGVKWRSASEPIAGRMTAVSRAGLAEAVRRARPGAPSAPLLDRGAQRAAPRLDVVDRPSEQRAELVAFGVVVAAARGGRPRGGT